jgi:hypothetical protein
MEAGGIRTRNHPLIRRSNPSCSLGSPQCLMHLAGERPGQKSARRLALAGAARGKPLQRPEVTLPAALDAPITQRRAMRQRSAKSPRATSTELAKYLRAAASRRIEPYKRSEIKGGKGSHLRTLAGALPVRTGYGGHEVPLPGSLAALRVCVRTGARPRDKGWQGIVSKRSTPAYSLEAARACTHYSTLTCLTASTCDAPPLTTEAM